MSEQLPFQVPPYAALADVYDQAGFADYARQAVAHYIAFAQSMDWAGRRVIDVGCGTGITTWWLIQNGFRAIGVDNNPHMLHFASSRMHDQGTLNFEPPDFVQMDIRKLESPMGLVDLVLAVGGTLNAIQSLREMEISFARVREVLEPGRLFMFDMRTIRGLSAGMDARDVVYYDNYDDLMVIVRNNFSFETLSTTRHVIIWRRQNGLWQRHDEIHTERGYPTQGIVALLERTGFGVRAILNPDMTPFDPDQDSFGRAVFVAVKSG